MSATNRGTEKISQDFYPTPQYSINSILPEIDFSKVHYIMEPCAGDHRILNSLPNNLSKYHCELSEGTDYLVESIPGVDLTLTNPPFTLAQPFIEKSIANSSCTIMLLRLNYLGSKSRSEFWKKHPPTHLFVLSSRPKFVAKCNNKKCSNNDLFQITEPIAQCPDCHRNTTPSSDATEYAWFCWDYNKILHKSPGIYVV